MIRQVRVIGLRGETMMIDLCDTEEQFQSITVLQLKEKIKDGFDYQDLPAEDIRLMFTDKSLEEDSSLLSAYGIQDMSVIRLVAKLPGGGEIPEPGKGDGGMGDKGGKNRSMENLFFF